MTYRPLTEEQIERGVERTTNLIDAAYMSGRLSDQEYHKAIAELNSWAEAKYEILRRFSRS